MAGERTDAKGVRDTAILRVRWVMAFRRGELAALDLKDLDLANRRLAVLANGKREKTWLTIPRGDREALEVWLVARGRERGPLFTSLHRGCLGQRLTPDGLHDIIGRIGVAAGLDRPARPHGIRHASITECARRANGNSIATQRFGRHANAATTSRYIDEYEDTFGRLAEMVDGSLDA